MSNVLCYFTVGDGLICSDVSINLIVLCFALSVYEELHFKGFNICRNCFWDHWYVCVFPVQQADEENEQRKKQEQMMMEKLLEQEAMMEEQEDQQVCLLF